MPLDGIYLSKVKEELTPLIGLGVSKITQPSRDEIHLSFRKTGLLISANPSAPRVNLTADTQSERLTNPQTPFMFCMLLRKYLSGARLVSITQDGFERVLYFDFEQAGIAGITDITRTRIAAEFTGRLCNIVVLDNSNTNGGSPRIIDALKRHGIPESVLLNINGETAAAARVLLPGAAYVPPPCRTRKNIFALSAEEITAEIAAFANQKPPEDEKLAAVLVRIFDGISPLFAREIAVRGYGTSDVRCGTAERQGYDNIVRYLRTLVYTPLILKEKAETAPKDFVFTDITQYGDLYEKEVCAGFSELLDIFYREKTRAERARQRGGDLYKKITALEERIKRKLDLQRDELAACGKRVIYKRYADILAANLYITPPRDADNITLTDYENPGLPAIIPIDKKLTLAKNMERYYALYKKLSKAEVTLRGVIEAGERDLVYVRTVLEVTERAVTSEEFAEIRRELAAAGLSGGGNSGKNNKNGKKQPKQLPFLKFILSGGFTAYAGRNNLQNDRLTLKTAAPADLWLHTKDIHGSHIIIIGGGKVIPQETISEAAVIAAYCSKARNGSRVPVDVTEARYVKKPNGARPGAVIFTHNKTVYVTPSAEIYEKLLVR